VTLAVQAEDNLTSDAVVFGEEFVEVDFWKLRKEMEANKEKMSDSVYDQWYKKFVKGLIGKAVKGNGFFEQAKDGWLGLGMTLARPFGLPDDVGMTLMAITVSLKDSEKSAAFALEKGAKVEFTGTVSSAMTMLGTLSVTVDEGVVGQTLMTPDDVRAQINKENPPPSADDVIEVDFWALFEEMVDKKASMTSLAFEQWYEESVNGLEGKFVKGRAFLYEVSDGWTGLHMSAGAPFQADDEGLPMTVEVYFRDDDAIKPDIAALEKYSQVEFIGKVNAVQSAFGLLAVSVTDTQSVKALMGSDEAAKWFNATYADKVEELKKEQQQQQSQGNDTGGWDKAGMVLKGLDLLLKLKGKKK
jgi:hypothetical protein